MPRRDHGVCRLPSHTRRLASGPNFRNAAPYNTVRGASPFVEPNTGARSRKTPSILILTPLLCEPCLKDHHRTSRGGDVDSRAASGECAEAADGRRIRAGASRRSPVDSLRLEWQQPLASRCEPARRPRQFDACAVVTEACASSTAIPFASPDEVELAVDVYHVDGDSNRPAVVLLGPGGWSSEFRETVSDLAIGTRPAGIGGLRR